MTSPQREIYVGIDVSKRSLDVCILREDDRQEGGESFVVSNDQEGVQEMLSRLEGASVELAVMEATGRYERLADRCSPPVDLRGHR